MSKQKEWWNSLRLYEKIFLVLFLVTSCVALAMACFFDCGYDLYVPLSWVFELFFVCSVVINWRKNRIMAYLEIIAAVIMGIYAIQGTLQLLY